MFIFGKKQDVLDEANEKALMPSGIVINAQRIFALLHAKAVVTAASIAKIENTAAEGNDPKSAEFHSAGEHMILARNNKEGEKIKKAVAFKGIQEYVKVFLGPDIAKKLTEDDCLPMVGNGEGGASGGEGEDGDGGDELSESHVFDLSFNRFLTECAFLKEDAKEQNNGEDAEEEDDGEDAGEDDDGDGAGEGDGEEDAGEGDGEEDAEEGDGGEDTDEDPKNIDEADGFYILYGLKIAGLKETTVADALKKWGSDIVKSIGIRFGNGFGGGMGDVHTIGGGLENIKGALGIIKDKAALENKIKDKLSKKFPKVSVAKVEFRDKKTLLGELDNPDARRENYDGKARQKINQADYSLCISIQDDDPSKPFVNRKDLANIVTMSMPGISAKLKNLIKADSIIYLRGSGLKSTTDDRINPESAFDGILPADVLDFLQQLKKNIDKASSKNEYKLFQNAFKKATKDKKIKNKDAVMRVFDVWKETTAEWAKGEITIEGFKDPLTKEDIPRNKFEFSTYPTAYEPWAYFYIKYKDAYDKNIKNNKNESYVKELAGTLLTEMFENPNIKYILDLYEDDEDDDFDDEDSDGDKTNIDGVDNPYEKQEGDDLYVIPMKGIKFDDDDDE